MRAMWVTRVVGMSLLAAVAAGRAVAAEPPPGPGAGAVPAPIAREISARAAQRGVAAEPLLAPLREAAARGVPVELVGAKVLEGLSKNVPPEKVILVARGLGDRLAAAGAVLDGARRSGLPPPADRTAASADLAAALATGVDRAELEALVEAARGARTGADAVVSAAHVQGELAARGVPPADSRGLALAIARHGARPPAEIPALFDAWRAEGGKAHQDFVGEATRRIDAGHPLDGMVDVFGEAPGHLNREAEREGQGRDAAAGAEGLARGHDKGFVPGAGNSGKGKAKGKAK